MKPTILSAVLTLVFLPGAIHAADDPFNPPQGLFSDNYYAIELGGLKCGYARIAAKREGPEKIGRASCRERV